MADKQLLSKLADVPLAKPEFDTFNMAAPVIVQMNPGGKWESSKPEKLDEKRLQAIVQHLVGSKVAGAAQSICSQCAAENKSGSLASGKSNNYVPVIMMPLYPADQCPFDMDCEVQKVKDAENKPKKTAKGDKVGFIAETEESNKSIQKSKKRGFVMQRLTDFDLLSQW